MKFPAKNIEYDEIYIRKSNCFIVVGCENLPLDWNDLGTDGSIEFKNGAGASELKVIGNTCGYIYIKSGGGYKYTIDYNDVQYGIFDKSASN